MKQKTMFAGLVMAVLTLSLVAACAAPASQGTSAPTAAASAPKPAASQPVDWTLGTAEPNLKDWSVAESATFAENIGKKTNGNFKIKVTVGDELGVERAAMPQLLSKGSIQMTFVSQAHTGTFPHYAVFGLPFLVGSKEGALADGHRLNDATIAITQREFKKLGISPLYFFVQTPVHLISNKPIADVSDLKGMKVRAWDETTSNIVKLLNGVPVVMAVTETYVAMQRGVVDGVLTGAPGMVSMSLFETGKYLYQLNMAPAVQHVAINDKAYDALSDDYKKIVQDEAKATAQRYKDRQPGAENEALDTMKSKGVQIFQPSADQMASARTKVMSIWDTWAAASALNKESVDAAKKAFGIQ